MPKRKGGDFKDLYGKYPKFTEIQKDYLKILTDPDTKLRKLTEEQMAEILGSSRQYLHRLRQNPDFREAIIKETFLKSADEVEEFNDSISTDDFKEDFDSASTDFRLAAVTAEFAEILRKSYWAKGAELADTLEKARQISDERKDDADIIELIDLISKANRFIAENPDIIGTGAEGK